MLAVVCLHLLFFLSLQVLLRPQAVADNEMPALKVRLIDEPGPVPPPAVKPLPRPVSQTASTMRSRAVEPSARSRSSEEVDEPQASTDKPRLFEPTGRIILPKVEPVASEDRFGAQGQASRFAADPLSHTPVLDYRRTRFDRRWVPDGETLGGTFVRKATFEKHWDTRGGNRIQCAVVVIFPACLWGWIPRMPIEELQAMRADPPPPR